MAKSEEEKAKYMKEYREKNKDKILKREKEYREKNKEKISEYMKDYMKEYYVENLKGTEKEKERHEKYREKNKDKAKEYRVENKDKSKEYMKKYREENKEELKRKNNEYKKRKRIEDPIFKFRESMYSMISKILKGYKNEQTMKIIGCDMDSFILYVESQFEPWMSWENYGKYNSEYEYGWDIDHIIELKTANSVDDLLKLNHYKNLRPLDSRINRVDRNKS
jgi:hypothetical protein